MIIKKFPYKKYSQLDQYYLDYLDEHSSAFNSVNLQYLDDAIKKLREKYKNGNKVFVCGNGGSAALANHFACDHEKILSSLKSLKPRLHCLISNNSLISAISNDKSYDCVFSDQIETHAIRGDLLICISSSGKSKNIINAIKTAKKKKIFVIAFTGFSGGYAKKNCNISLHCNSFNYGVIESVHHSLMNIISQYIRNQFLTEKKIRNTYF
jgi:phosphoheptose isomerase